MSADIPHTLAITIESLKKHSFDARFAPAADDASNMVLEMIPVTARVGIGDSTGLRQVGVLGELVKRGNEVINPFVPEISRGAEDDAEKHRVFIQTVRDTLGTDVYVTSCNALTEDGKIVSIDRAGNRVAGMIFGAPRVILVVGRNKIAKDVDSALDRVKNVIVPNHARQKRRQVPCVATGKCSDCDSPSRLCSVTVIMERKPLHTDLSLILVDEDLGLGWDPTWDEERIEKIRSRYQEYSWAFSVAKS